MASVIVIMLINVVRRSVPDGDKHLNKRLSNALYRRILALASNLVRFDTVL